MYKNLDDILSEKIIDKELKRTEIENLVRYNKNLKRDKIEYVRRNKNSKISLSRQGEIEKKVIDEKLDKEKIKSGAKKALRAAVVGSNLLGVASSLSSNVKSAEDAVLSATSAAPGSVGWAATGAYYAKKGYDHFKRNNVPTKDIKKNIKESVKKKIKVVSKSDINFKPKLKTPDDSDVLTNENSLFSKEEMENINKTLRKIGL